MPLYTVSYDISNGDRGPGKAVITESSLSNLKMTVEARSQDNAQAIVRAMFGPNCHTYSANLK